MKNFGIFEDLAINATFVKGHENQVKNCWHFFSKGDDVDLMFYDQADYVAGMNRIYVASRKYEVDILAFSLMETHYHFVLHGDFDQCNRFIHDYTQRTSQFISRKHGDQHKLQHVSIRHETIDTDVYLKTVICYVIKNAMSAGMPYSATSHPWSSGPLYFAPHSYWALNSWPDIIEHCKRIQDLGVVQARTLLGSKENSSSTARVINGIVFPGDYVNYETVERLYKTQKSFHYFLSLNKDTEIESRGGAISQLSISLQEMKMNRDKVMLELFGFVSLRRLSVDKRLLLARKLRVLYNCSVKQIAKLCGLVYNEVKDMI